MDKQKVLYRAYWENTNLNAEYWEQQVIEIKFQEYPVIRETKECFVIPSTMDHETDKTKHVLKVPYKKAFAYLTKERALEAFIKTRKAYRRRLHSIKITNDRLIEIAEDYVIPAES